MNDGLKGLAEREAGGNKFDSEKIRLDLIPPEAIFGLGEVLTFGAIKYGDRNWEKGIAWSRVFGATLRHLWIWFARNDLDPEVRVSHLKCAQANIAFLVTYEGRHVGTDDRKETSVIQGSERWSRDWLIRSFDGVLDPFVFEDKPSNTP